MLNDRESEMSENKLGTHGSLIQHTPYKYICFRPQLILILAVAFGPLLGRYLLLHSTASETGGIYIPPTSTRMCTMKRKTQCVYIAQRSF